MTFGETPAGRSLSVTVSGHAIVRSMTRRHFGNLARVEVAARIAHEVQQALAAGRVSDQIPVWAARFRMRELNGAKPKPAPCEPGSRFVWDIDERLGWLIRRDGGDTVVVTALQRVRAGQVAA